MAGSIGVGEMPEWGQGWHWDDHGMVIAPCTLRYVSTVLKRLEVILDEPWIFAQREASQLGSEPGIRIGGLRFIPHVCPGFERWFWWGSSLAVWASPGGWPLPNLDPTTKPIRPVLEDAEHVDWEEKMASPFGL